MKLTLTITESQLGRVRALAVCNGDPAAETRFDAGYRCGIARAMQILGVPMVDAAQETHHEVTKATKQPLNHEP